MMDITVKAFHASALVVVLQVAAGAAVLARRGQTFIYIELAAVARVPYTTIHYNIERTIH